MIENVLATPDLTALITAIFGGLAGVLLAVGTLIATIRGAKKQILDQGTRIEHATNGAVAAAASEATEKALKVALAGARRQLSEEIARGIEAAEIARQAAADARSDSEPKPAPEEGDDDA